MFSWIAGLFHKLGALFTGDKAKHAFEKALELSEMALPIVKTIAAMTPTKADDEIVAAYEKYGLPILQGSPEDLLKTLVGKLLRIKIADKELPQPPDHQIRAGVELAVLAMKNEG